MKKFNAVIVAILLIGLSRIGFAAPVGKSSLLPYNDVVILGCDSLTIGSVTLSSTTATLIKAAKVTRRGIVIRNTTGSGYVVYLATYPATSSAALYPLADGIEFSDDSSPYIGAWYVLGAPLISTSTALTMEKW